MLICNLEDVAVVNKVIMSKPLKRCDEVLEQNEVSLDELLSRGEEALSQHIAKWICLFKINPNLLVDKTDAEFQVFILLHRQSSVKSFLGGVIQFPSLQPFEYQTNI